MISLSGSQTLYHLLDTNQLIPPFQGEWKWHSPLQPPFQIYGFPWIEKDGAYRRLPQQCRTQLREAVDRLSECTAGGQIRFRTDAGRMAIRVKLAGPASMDHMTAIGQCGFDAYIDEPGNERYVGSSRLKPSDQQYEAILFDGDLPNELRTITLNFPLYQSVQELEIGLPVDATVLKDTGFGNNGKLVFYGTSITQGGCASRPGLAYPQQIGRSLQREVVNLGFSGNGKGDPAVAKIAREIPNVDGMIIDYEGNCTTELYRATLQPFVELYREKNPFVPILIVSRIPYATELISNQKRLDRLERKRIAFELVQELKRQGDKQIFFLDGETLLGDRYDECTVDGVHPNDLGFTLMANSISDVLRTILDL